MIGQKYIVPLGVRVFSRLNYRSHSLAQSRANVCEPLGYFRDQVLLDNRFFLFLRLRHSWVLSRTKSEPTIQEEKDLTFLPSSFKPVMATDICYTLVHQDDATEQPTLQEFQRAFERGSDEVRIETMKKLLVIMLNGDPMEKLLLHVIRCVVPSKNKQLKKLLHFYWEICPKTKADGKLKEEFILVW